MKIINQISDFDCTLATLAMFFGKTHDEMAKAHFADYEHDRPVSETEEIAVFKAFGAKRIDFPTYYGPIPGAKAMVTVPSLNTPGKSHYLYYDGRGYCDPQHNRKGKKVYSYESSPSVMGLVLDLKCPKSVKMVSDCLWLITSRLSEGLCDGEGK